MAKDDDQAAFDALCQQYTPFIFRRATHCSHLAGADIEDFIQEGRLALYRAVKGYNPGMGIRFTTYAMTCINNAMTSMMRLHMRSEWEQEPLALDDLDDQRLYRALAQGEDNHPEELFIQMEIRDQRNAQINRLLSPFERNVLDHYLSGQSYQDIAREMCTSAKAVDNALQRVRRKLRQKP